MSFSSKSSGQKFHISYYTLDHTFMLFYLHIYAEINSDIASDAK